MQADDIPLTEFRADNTILAERGEADKALFLDSTQTPDRTRVMNWQKEMIVTS